MGSAAQFFGGAKYYSAASGTYNLGVSYKRLNIFDPAGAGVVVQLPEHVDTVVGGPIFYVANVGVDDITVKYNTTTIATVAQDKAVILIHVSGSNWHAILYNLSEVSIPPLSILAYFFAGRTSGIVDGKTMLEFNPELGTWATMSSATNYHAECSGLEVSGLGYYYGGATTPASSQRQISSYDVDVWNSGLTFSPIGFYANQPHGFAVNDECYWVSGNELQVNIKNYSTGIDSWTTSWAAPPDDMDEGVTANVSDVGHCIGHDDGGSAWRPEDIHRTYTPDPTDAWAVIAVAIAIPITGETAFCVHDDLIWFFGGGSSLNGGTIEDDVRTFDAVTETWTTSYTVQPFGVRKQHGACRLEYGPNTYAFLSMGRDATTTYNLDCWRYDFVLDSYLAQTDSPDRRTLLNNSTLPLSIA